MVIFEVCAYLFEFKEDDPPHAGQPQEYIEYFEDSAEASLKCGNFEHDVEIGQTVPFCKGLV